MGTKKVTKQPDQDDVKLNWWPDEKRAMPTLFARSALFAGTQLLAKDRLMVKNVVIPSQGDDRIEFTGERLDQSDCDVWLQADHQQHVPLPGRRPGKALALRQNVGRSPQGRGHHGPEDHDQPAHDAQNPENDRNCGQIVGQRKSGRVTHAGQ